MELTTENIEKTKAFFEEATIVFATLEARVLEFNESAKKLENIEDRLQKINDRISLSEIQREIAKSISHLRDADLLIEQYAQDIQSFRAKQLNYLIALSFGLISGFITSILTFALLGFITWTN